MMKISLSMRGIPDSPDSASKFTDKLKKRISKLPGGSGTEIHDQVEAPLPTSLSDVVHDSSSPSAKDETGPSTLKLMAATELDEDIPDFDVTCTLSELVESIKTGIDTAMVPFLESQEEKERRWDAQIEAHEVTQVASRQVELGAKLEAELAAKLSDSSMYRSLARSETLDAKLYEPSREQAEQA